MMLARERMLADLTTAWEQRLSLRASLVPKPPDSIKTFSRALAIGIARTLASRSSAPKTSRSAGGDGADVLSITGEGGGGAVRIGGVPGSPSSRRSQRSRKPAARDARVERA